MSEVKKTKTKRTRAKSKTLPVTPEVETIKRDYSPDPGHFEGAYWVWGDDRKTPLNSIRNVFLTRNGKLPPGFYAAAAKGTHGAMQHLCKVAKDRGIVELI